MYVCKLISLNMNGYTEYYSGGNRMSCTGKDWQARECVSYTGCIVLDKRQAPFEKYAAMSMKGPLVGVDLPPGGRDGLPWLPSAFDRVALDVYLEKWCKIEGVRIGGVSADRTQILFSHDEVMK